MESTVTPFSPGSDLLGGARIGLPAGAMPPLTGRIPGVSGVAAGLLTRDWGEARWRAPHRFLIRGGEEA